MTLVPLSRRCKCSKINCMDLLAALDDDVADAAYVPEPCKLGRILASLSPEQGNLLQQRLADWSAEKLAHQLRKTPQRVGATTIKSHLRGECGCF